MAIQTKRCVRLVLLLACSIGLGACNATPAEPVADTAAQPESSAAAGAVAVDELPDRNTEGMDVCAVLPGSAVASALRLTLVEAAPGTGMCSYTLRRDSGSEVGVVVSLATSMSFIVTRNTSENATTLPGLGVAAFSRKATGIRQDLWVARQDGLFLRVAGHDDDVAEPVARVALATIP
jgi:hypothetical protein